jgi:hypothetical protein
MMMTITMVMVMRRGRHRSERSDHGEKCYREKSFHGILLC